MGVYLWGLFLYCLEEGVNYCLYVMGKYLFGYLGVVVGRFEENYLYNCILISGTIE